MACVWPGVKPTLTQSHFTPASPEGSVKVEMTRYPQLTREIHDSPRGPEIAAFFDLDRTLIDGFSVLRFFRDGIRHGRWSAPQIAELMMATASFELSTVDFSAYVDATSSVLAGMPEEEFEALGERLFEESISAEIYPEARAIADAHRRMGHTLAVVSSATPYQARPVARELGIPHVLATELEVRDGILTGATRHPSCYGEGKADAARKLAAEKNLDLSESWFYSDSDEDLPLFEIVGRPRPTNPNRGLQQIAARRDWPAFHFAPRSMPTMAEFGRTVLAVGSLAPSLALSLPAAWLTGDWQRAVNVATSTWGELASALAGIDIRTSGEEHLWERRPAVFIFNHQSGVDALVICRLLQRDFVGVSKKELEGNPILGPALSLAGTVFVDRFHPTRAAEALAPATDALRRGLSIAIAPEGTRSSTHLPGPFKKGAFHIAMQAGVPIIPIVLRNTIDALPRHWFFVRPTTIEVVVRPPIDTTGWKRADLPARIREIREDYLEVIGS